MNYERITAICKRLIDANGRSISMFKLSNVVADVTKPWLGTITPQPVARIDVRAVFVIGNTSIPTESRGLAFDWVDQDLLKITRKVCIVPAVGLPVLEDYKLITDGSAKQWDIMWGQCLSPGDTRLLYVFGLKE